jgi:hypothetical protein
VTSGVRPPGGRAPAAATRVVGARLPVRWGYATFRGFQAEVYDRDDAALERPDLHQRRDTMAFFARDTEAGAEAPAGRRPC